jgi:hypothetical protein
LTKTLVIAAAGAALFGSVALLPVATGAQNRPTGIPGFLDPSTGVFTARPSFPLAGAGISVSGSITVTTNVLIDAALQKVPDQTIMCTVNIATPFGDPVANNSATGTNFVIRAGTKGVCTTTITFIWEVASTTKNMNLTVSLSSGNFGTPGVTHNDSSITTSIPITTKKATVNLAL